MSVTFYTTNHFWHHYLSLEPATNKGCPDGTALIVSLFLFTDYSATDARSRLSTGGSAPRATPTEPRYNSIPRRRK